MRGKMPKRVASSDKSLKDDLKRDCDASASYDSRPRRKSSLQSEVQATNTSAPAAPAIQSKCPPSSSQRPGSDSKVLRSIVSDQNVAEKLHANNAQQQRPRFQEINVSLPQDAMCMETPQGAGAGAAALRKVCSQTCKCMRKVCSQTCKCMLRKVCSQTCKCMILRQQYLCCVFL